MACLTYSETMAPGWSLGVYKVSYSLLSHGSNNFRYSHFSFLVKYFSPATSTAIIRVSRDHYRMVWAALTFTTQLPNAISQECVIQVVRVSGTIKKAEEEAIRRARLSIQRARREANPHKSTDASGSQPAISQCD